MRTLTPLVLCSLAAAQTTWIVDDSGGPGVHFTSLPAAVAAAASGDTLLVAAGTYQAFHVANKALTILGAGATGPMATLIASPVPSGSQGTAAVRVATPPAGTTFRMAGLAITPSAPLSTHTVQLSLVGGGGSGNVVLTDVECRGGASGVAGLSVDGIEVHASRCLFFAGTSLLGGAGASVVGNGVLVADASWFRGGTGSQSGLVYLAIGGSGLSVMGARAWLFRSRLEGGDAVNTTGLGPTGAGAGLACDGNSVARVYGSAGDAIVGGSATSTSWNPGAGGPGIVCQSGGSISLCGPVTVMGGTASPGSSGPAASGPGAVVSLPSRPVTSVQGSSTSASDIDFDGGQPVTLSLQGGPGQLAILFLCTMPTLLQLPGVSDDPLLVDPTALVVFGGALDSNGAYSFAFTPATQAPILLDVPLHFQGCVFDAASGLWLGSNAEIRRIR